MPERPQTASASATISAPAAAYSASLIAESVPASVSTSTETSCATSSCTPSGVMATRCSPSFTSRGTPIVMAALTGSRPLLARLLLVGVRRGGNAGELVGGRGQAAAEDGLDLVELVLARHERRRELHHRVAAVVGPADQALLEQHGREEAAQHRLALLLGEVRLGLGIGHQLEGEEVPRAADVADDRKVPEALD